jgi:hypothetical protein
MNVRRWLVEGSFAPFIFGFLIEYCIGRPNIIFDEYQLFSIVEITLKVPLLDALCRKST